MSVSDVITSLSDKKPSSPMAERRILRDFCEIQTDNQGSPIIFVNSIDDNLFHLEAAISGPASTPYENGVFLLEIKLSELYPFSPPLSVTFKRPVMHPNVDEFGKFKSDLLTPASWSPAVTIKGILEHVWQRFAIPDVYSNECDPIRAKSYKRNQEQFEIMAREYSIKYAAAT